MAPLTNLSDVSWFHYLPFIGMVLGKGRNGGSILATRLVEAAIIGGIAGYITLVKMEVKFEALKEDVQELRVKVDKVFDDIYKPRIP